MPEDNTLIEKLYTTFTDLTREELAGDVYLVCRIYRFVKLHCILCGKIREAHNFQTLARQLWANS